MIGRLKLIIALLVVLIGLGVSNAFAQDSKVIFPGEYLEYKVTFLGIKLGTITITSKGYADYNGKRVFNAVATMKSSEGIPFVSLHAIYESWMSTSLTNGYKFVANAKTNDEEWIYQEFLTDYDKKNLHYEEWVNKELKDKKDIPISNKVCDGCSLFFFARQYTDLKRTVRVPTIIDDSVFYTVLNLHGEKGTTEIDAVKYPVKTLYFDGKAEWEGIYGLKGVFKGWFSDDEARVPIKAQMNVYVGNVNIELVKWQRGNWQPPK